MKAVEKVWRAIETGQPSAELLKLLRIELRKNDEEPKRKSFICESDRDWRANLNVVLIAIIVDRKNILNQLAIDCYELLNRDSFEMRSDAIRNCSNWLLCDDSKQTVFESQTDQIRSLIDVRYDFRLLGLFYRLLSADADDDGDCCSVKPKTDKSKKPKSSHLTIYGRIFGVCKLALFYPDLRANELFPAPLMLNDNTTKKTRTTTDTSTITTTTTTTTTTSATVNDSRQLKKVYRKKSNKHYDHSTDLTTLSSSTDNCDSESDFQSENESCMIDVLTKKIHQIGLKLLILIIEQSPKNTVCNYWFHFVSDTDSSLQSFYKRNHAHQKLQLTLLQVLKVMMAESKPLLEHSEYEQNTGGGGGGGGASGASGAGNLTFISLGESIGQSIVQLHEFLLDIVRPMNSSITILRLQALKCFECLVVMTPYAKMFAKHSRLLKDFAFVMKTMILKQTDVHLKTSAFCIVRHLIKCNLPIFNNLLLFVVHNNEKPLWILSETFRNLLFNWNGTTFYWNSAPQILTVPPCLQIESLQMFRTLFELKDGSLETLVWTEYRASLMQALRKTLENQNETVRLYTLKTLQTIGQCLTNDLFAEEFWTELLSGEYFFDFAANESSTSVNEAFSECFAGLRYEIIAKLESSTVRSIFDYLKKTIVENLRESIQLTAVDTLAAITTTNASKLFTNRYCYQTIFDVIIVTLTKTSTDSLRFGDKVKDRTALLLGLVTDTFVQIDTPEPIIDFIREILPITYHYSPIKQWRIVTKLVHVISNLFVALQHHRTNAPFALLFETNSSKIIRFLLDCLNDGRCHTDNDAQQPNVKVKWNVCYSFTSILQAFHEHVLNIENNLFIEIVDRLTNELETSSNFKVRTNASLALKVAIIDRGAIGDRYMRIWKVLVRALVKAEEISDFKEYEHQKSLKAQICTTIVHWMTMLKKTDLQELRANITGPFDDNVFERNSIDFKNQLHEFDSQLLDFQKQLLIELVGGGTLIG